MPIYIIEYKFGAVAQWAEYRIVYPVVAGSSPVGLAMVVVAQSAERRIVVPKVEGSSPFNHPHWRTVSALLAFSVWWTILAREFGAREVGTRERKVGTRKFFFEKG